MNERSRAHLALLVVLLLATKASAQENDELLRRGLDLRHQGRDEEALVVFARAYDERPGPGTAAQLGLAHQSLGHWIDADRLLGEALAAPDDPWVRRNSAALAAARAVIGRHLGTLDVRGEPEGAEVVVDGQVVGRLPMAAPVRVIAGVRTLDVRMDGFVTTTRRLVVEPGDSVRESIPALTLAPRDAPDASADASRDAAVESPRIADAPRAASSEREPRARPAPSSSTRDALTVAAFALGGAGIAAGVAAFAARAQVAGTYNAACPGAGAAVCDDLSSSFQAWTTTAWVTLPLGVVAAGVGAWLFATRPAGTSARGLASLRCAPSVSPGVGCALRFE